MSEGTVTIPMSEYQMLKKDQLLLKCLYRVEVYKCDCFGKTYSEYLDIMDCWGEAILRILEKIK